MLSIFRDAGLTVKKKKCVFGAEECTFLGHTVGRGRVRPEMAKVAAIKDFERPKSKKDVRAFLGLAGYYRCFIPPSSILFPQTIAKGDPLHHHGEGVFSGGQCSATFCCVLAGTSVRGSDRALKYLTTIKHGGQGLSRWALALQPFSYTIRHQTGESHGNADGLSRKG